MHNDIICLGQYMRQFCELFGKLSIFKSHIEKMSLYLTLQKPCWFVQVTGAYCKFTESDKDDDDFRSFRDCMIIKILRGVELGRMPNDRKVVGSRQTMTIIGNRQEGHTS